MNLFVCLFAAYGRQKKHRSQQKELQFILSIHEQSEQIHSSILLLWSETTNINFQFKNHYFYYRFANTSNGMGGLSSDMQKRLAGLLVNKPKGAYIVQYTSLKFHRKIFPSFDSKINKSTFEIFLFLFESGTTAPKSIPMQQMNQHGYGNDDMEY